jgi:hypothetical protein
VWAGYVVAVYVILQREALEIVRDPTILLTIFGTVLTGMLVIRVTSWAGSSRLAHSLRLSGHLGTHLIEVFDAVGLAAFLVVSVDVSDFLLRLVPSLVFFPHGARMVLGWLGVAATHLADSSRDATCPTKLLPGTANMAALDRKT